MENQDQIKKDQFESKTRMLSDKIREMLLEFVEEEEATRGVTASITFTDDTLAAHTSISNGVVGIEKLRHHVNSVSRDMIEIIDGNHG